MLYKVDICIYRSEDAGNKFVLEAYFDITRRFKIIRKMLSIASLISTL